uniref:Uncharacterized protein n=1 Tax=Stomoxys calcitrans TaxID=35570 RepID=A0A1I8Q3Y8_STOCA
MKTLSSSSRKAIILCIFITCVCTACIIQFSGFRHEEKKFKQIMVTVLIVIFSRFIVWEHLEFALIALYKSRKGRNKPAQVPKAPKTKEHINFSTLDYLKVRLESAKEDLQLDAKHKDENLNIEYRLLTKDLWLFGKYFLLVLLLIVYSRNPYGYYNTKIWKTLLEENRLSHFGLPQMMTIEDLYQVINGSFTHCLNQGSGYDGLRLTESGWTDFEMAKLLGVVRLQQIRLLAKENGMKTLQYDHQDYMPEWRSKNRTLYYVDKYWRIYYPWLCKTYQGVLNWLMTFSHMGSLYSYKENKGYVTLLARDQGNSEKIVKFLKDHNWLDLRTAAVLIDFTLYSVDGNMFTLVSILVEQTPFGNLIWQLNLQSVVLLTNLDQLTYGQWLLIVIYTLQLLQFCKTLALKWWFNVKFFQVPWNYVDLGIIFLNLLIFSLLILRENSVRDVLATLESSNKLNDIDFRLASWWDYWATISMGFLVALTTLRLWKILQFASVFRLFTRTLYTAAGSLAITILAIHIFLFAMGLAAQIVNGSQTEIFSRYLKSLTSIMSFSFGFNSHTRPEDLSHGGNVLGFILYLVLMFVVAIFLINMFITLICDHFAEARKERDKLTEGRLSYLEFLQQEYEYLWDYIKPVFDFRFQRKSKVTIDENYNKIELKGQRNDLSEVEHSSIEADLIRSKRIEQVVEILHLQMEILRRQTMLDYLEYESEDE